MLRQASVVHYLTRKGYLHLAERCGVRFPACTLPRFTCVGITTRSTMSGSCTNSSDMKSEVEANLDLSKLRYSMVWEDAVMLSEALDIKDTDTILSITSSGDNVLHMLLGKPKKIFAVDFSPTQNAVLHLKIAAIKELTREEAIKLMGYLGTPDERLALLKKLKTLPDHAKGILVTQLADGIAKGLALNGLLEGSIAKLRQACQDGKGTQNMKDFLNASTPQARLEILHSWPLERIFNGHRETCNALADHGRDSAQFKYVHLSANQYGVALATRLSKWFLQEASMCRDNHYLSAFLLGLEGICEIPMEEIDQHLPFYLHRGNFEALKDLVDRVEVYSGSIEDKLGGEFVFDKANLSDIFEYMSIEAAHVLMNRLTKSCSVGGRIAMWNLLCARHPPSKPDCGGRYLQLLGGLSAKLSAQDRVPFYQDFFVCECQESS